MPVVDRSHLFVFFRVNRYTSRTEITQTAIPPENLPITQPNYFLASAGTTIGAKILSFNNSTH